MADSSNCSTLNVSNAIRRLTMEETRDLVFRTGVPLNVLKDIAAQYDGENRKQNYVQTWLEIDPGACWNKLVTVLRDMNKNAIAIEIESKYLSRITVPSCASPLHLSTSSISVPSSPAVKKPGHLGTATPASNGSLTPFNQTTIVFEHRVGETRDAIEHLEEQFSDLKYQAQKALSNKQNEDPEFVEKVKTYLLDMPVTKKQIHIRFFTRNEDDILNASTIQKIFAILSRYCNYSNYEIIFHIVNRFCNHELKGRMLKYRDSLTSFEKSTTVDVYLCAISAHPGGGVRDGFIRMTMKINKQPSECTLYEIRVLKESIERTAHMEPYAMYIETPGEGSVCVKMLVPWEVFFLVATVLTPSFREEHLLTEVTMKRWAVKKGYLVRN